MENFVTTEPMDENYFSDVATADAAAAERQALLTWQNSLIPWLTGGVSMCLDRQPATLSF